MRRHAGRSRGERLTRMEQIVAAHPRRTPEHMLAARALKGDHVYPLSPKAAPLKKQIRFFANAWPETGLES